MRPSSARWWPRWNAGGVRLPGQRTSSRDSTVILGTQPGVYPQLRSDPLYVKSHIILLTGLPPANYYYRVQSRDQSGNLAQSSEGSFTINSGPTHRGYLPLVLR